MSNFKNMKIDITPEQPLDEIIDELERLGYINGVDTLRHFIYTDVLSGSDVLGVNGQGYILSTNASYILDNHTQTTITELKLMK